MPSHIYYRVGRYLDALNANKAAVAVDENYIAAIAPTGPYPLAYYPHNVHFLLAAAQLAGDSKTALEAAASCERIVRQRPPTGCRWCSPTWRPPTGPMPCSARPTLCWRWTCRTTRRLT